MTEQTITRKQLDQITAGVRWRGIHDPHVIDSHWRGMSPEDKAWWREDVTRALARAGITVVAAAKAGA